MKSSIWAKILGWGQFGLTAMANLAQGMQSNGTPHGWANWTVMIASLATAAAIHSSSNTDGTK